jgi:hypothetical protein
MFLKYRIERLKKKIYIQKAAVEKIEVVEKQYGSSYYTDLILKEHRKWLELNSKLHFLMRKADT